jgi:WD40 repeat protein
VNLKHFWACATRGARIFRRGTFLESAFLCFIFTYSALAVSEPATKSAAFKESFVVGGMDFSPNGRELAINGMLAPPEVHIREWSTHPHITRVLHLDSLAGDGGAIRYSPDGALLAVGHFGDKQTTGINVIRIWNAQTGEIAHDLADSVGGSGAMSFAFSADGKFLVRTVERNGLPGDYLAVHSSNNWEEMWGLPTLPFIPRTLALSPDGALLAVAGETATLGPNGPPITLHPNIMIIDIGSRQIRRTIEDAFPDQNEIHTLAWSPDGKSLATGAIVQGSFKGPDAVKIFDPASGAVIASEPAQVAYVNGLAYSPDGRYLIEGYIDGHVRIWDSQHSKLLQKIQVDDHFHTVLTVSRDSKHLAIGSGKEVLIYELK